MKKDDAATLLRLAQTSDLQEFVDLGYALLGNPLFLDDMFRTVLAYSRAVTIDDPKWQDYVVENARAETARTRKTAKAIYAKSLSDGHAIYLDDAITVPRLALTLTNHGQPIGNLTLASHCRPIQEGDRELFELIGTFAAHILTQSHLSLRQTQPLVVNALILLLDGAPVTRSAIESKLADRSWVLEHDSYLLALADESGDSASIDSRSALEDLSHLPYIIAFPYDRYLLCLYSPPQRINRWDLQVPELNHILTKYNLYAGISNCFSDFMQLSLQYQAAVQAFKMGRILFRQDQRFLLYGDISIFHLFEQIASHIDLLNYCEDKLLSLAKYDRSHERNLLHTLQVYLETCLQLTVTAERLFIHKNTVRYRIAKCKEFLGADFTDGEKIFRYTFSLKILEYFQYF